MDQADDVDFKSGKSLLVRMNVINIDYLLLDQRVSSLDFVFFIELIIFYSTRNNRHKPEKIYFYLLPCLLHNVLLCIVKENIVFLKVFVKNLIFFSFNSSHNAHAKLKPNRSLARNLPVRRYSGWFWFCVWVTCSKTPMRWMRRCNVER